MVVKGTCGRCGRQHKRRLQMDDPNSRRQGTSAVWWRCECGRITELERMHVQVDDDGGAEA